MPSSERRNRFLAGAGALVLAVAALFVVPLADAWRLFGRSHFSPFSGSALPPSVPLLGCCVAAMVVAAGVGLGFRDSRRRGFVHAAALLPAFTAFVEAFRRAYSNAAAPCDDGLAFWEMAGSLASAIEKPIEVAAEGTLRSGTLLLLLAFFAIPWGAARRHKFERSVVLSACTVVAVTVAPRFLRRGETTILDLLGPLGVAVAAIAVAASFTENDSNGRSAWAAVAGLLLLDVGAMAAAESEALHTLAQPGLSRADLTRLLEALVVRGRFRSFTPFVDLGVVGFFAIFVRRRARATANVWTDQRLELALAAAAVGLVAVFGATSLRWSGGVRRLSMVSAALARLSPEAGPIASDTDAPWCLPADLSDPTLSIDRNASLRVVPRLGRPREAARHGMQNSASQLLVVESRDRWLGLLVAFRIGAPSFFPSETTDDDDTRVVPLERSSVGYHIAGDNATWRETALRAHVHEDSVIAFLPRNTLPADVAGVAKTLMNGDRVYPAFRRVVLSAPREATEAPLSAAVESYLSKRRADCVAAGRKAIEESAKTREAFEELLRKNPTLSSESLEFVVGALTLSAGSWRPNAVMRITDCATGTALGCDGSREQFAVDYEFGGTAVSKRSGSTRGTWHATPGHQPSIRFGSVQVSGHFAPESSEAGIPNPIDLVRKIVRPKFGEFRRCYKKGLEKNPDLQGQVTVRFTIAKDGSVTNVVHAGHEFADAEGARCIARVFPDLTFPRPAGGVVRVAMPVTLMAQ